MQDSKWLPDTQFLLLSQHLIILKLLLKGEEKIFILKSLFVRKTKQKTLPNLLIASLVKIEIQFKIFFFYF